MTPTPSATTIPARLTASELAAVIGRQVSEIRAVLTARGEPDGPDDILAGDLAVSVAGVLGHRVAVEPRDLALELLYRGEAHPEGEDDPLPSRVQRLVEGVRSQAEDLDQEIEAASQHWSVARMPMIDRAILRLGLWELRNDPDTPTAVVVSEAVRLANTYSTGRSGAFVNGVLATLARSARPE